jgi:hypothetical protein
LSGSQIKPPALPEVHDWPDQTFVKNAVKSHRIRQSCSDPVAVPATRPTLLLSLSAEDSSFHSSAVTNQPRHLTSKCRLRPDLDSTFDLVFQGANDEIWRVTEEGRAEAHNHVAVFALSSCQSFEPDERIETIGQTISFHSREIQLRPEDPQSQAREPAIN